MRTDLWWKRWVFGAIGLLLTGAAHGAFVWDTGRGPPTRIELAAGETRRVVDVATADAVVPLPDGGAWLQQGNEIVRVDPDLRVQARATVGVAHLMHWESQSRRLWVAVGSELLRFDDRLVLDVARVAGGPIRGLAGSGPDAIWVATDSRIVRYDRHGAQVDALDLSAIELTEPVAGVLADPLRARIWVVGRAGRSVEVDTSDRMRATGLALATSSDAAAVTVDVATGTVSQFVRGAWLPMLRGSSATESREAVAASIGVLRFGDSDERGVAAAVSGAFVDLGATNAKLHRMPGVDWALLLESPSSDRWGPSARLKVDLSTRCGDGPCIAPSALLGTVIGSMQLADLRLDAKIRNDDGRWWIEAKVESVLEPGVYPLSARVVDAYGNEGRLTDYAAVVDADGSIGLRRITPKGTPVVSITAPANNASYVAPASITITATASVAGATLTKVEFYRNGTLLATDTSSPYSYAWTNVAVGTYALTAKAYDNAGGSTTSSAVNVTVRANTVPTVSLTAPANNAVFTAPATINLAATAADSDGTVAKVEFFNGATRLNTDTTSPYGYTWTNVAGGTYTLTAKATDDKGAVTTSAAITAIVNRPPTTAITAPANNAALVAPLNLTVTASASDPDGTISKVEFFRDGTLVATDTTSPYSYAWNNVPLGTYTLTSKATDNRGATTASAPVTFTVNANVGPSVAITSPANGAQFVYPASIPITATASDSDGTIVRVEFHYDYGVLAHDTTSPYSYTLNSSYTGTGTFVLTAKAVDNKGAITTSAPVSITIIPNQPPTVTLTGNPPPGPLVTTVPPTITLTATAADPDGAVASVLFLRQDQTTYEFVQFAVVNQPPFTTQYVATTLDPPYVFRADAVDNGGSVGSSNEITYWVTENRAPDVTILEPTVNAQYAGFIAPATIVLVTTAREFDPAPDQLTRVEYLANGTLIGTVTTPNGAAGEYVHVWRNVPAGTYGVMARAVDTFGAVGEWSGTIKVTDAGTPAALTIVQPVTGTSYGDPVPLQVNVTPGTVPIAKVDYINAWGRKIGTSTVAPYTATWSQPPSGRHAVTAVAVHTNDIVVTSPTVYFDVGGGKGPPLVVLTAPTALTTINADAPITVAADAYVEGASITKVEFFRNGTLIGTATTPPYQIAWSSPPLGVATLTAIATDGTAPASASTATSPPITVTLTSSNPWPTVGFTAPANGSTHGAPATIVLDAYAHDANGTVTKVEFFADGTLIGTDTTAPFSVTWSNVPAGTYLLTAKATDNGGAVGTSAAISVTVVANAPPTVTLTAPTTGQSFAFGVPILLTANATDTTGTVTRVDFYDGATLLGSDTTAPYEYTWTTAAVGSHAVTARAIDNMGATATTPAATIAITANQVPTVSLALPRNGQQFVTGQSIELVAIAGDGDGSVARVEFLSGSTVIATDTTAPYTHTVTNAQYGTYSLSARVIDNLGAVRSTSVSTIHVMALSVGVTVPTEGAQIAADFAFVRGTFVAPENSGVLVNGLRAQVFGDQFFANHVSLVEGANALKVVVITPDDQMFATTHNVTRTGSSALRIYTDPEAGFAPLVSTIRVENKTGTTIADVSYENLGGATLDPTGVGQTMLGRLTIGTPGIVAPTIVVTDSTGTVHRHTVGLLTINQANVEALLRNQWGDFSNALAAGRVDLALQGLPATTAAHYREYLVALGPYLPSIVPTWSAPQVGHVGLDVGEFAIGRTIDGQKRAFFIYFVRDGRGIWRIGSM